MAAYSLLIKLVTTIATIISQNFFTLIKPLLMTLSLSPIMEPLSVKAVCNVCQTNGVACINLTSYYFCFGEDKPYTNQIFTCRDGLACSDLPQICFQRSTHPASCGDTASCDQCNANQVFACTSRTTFELCFGATIPLGVSGVCPKEKMCDASRQTICTDIITSESVICDRDAF